ncbi:cell death abnormality protein 1-like [Haliotis rubra]|uniref:cell death abnormality protein 1-like n=1 Tax=Haliotis rubra TaxID=36100 RepID=UPI001EE6040B|nr:cell death abnormality protein 1-like [Haliotis rubra]
MSETCREPACATTSTSSTHACSPGNNCLMGTCRVTTGGIIVCEHGCKDGFSGKLCNIPCLPNCLKCSQRRANDCMKCKKRHVGEFCENECPISCAEGCYRNGVCRKHCSDSHVCGDKCLPRCKQCNFTSGVCQKCDTHYTGDNCETDCTNCLGKCSSSGCPEGCINGFHGDKCDTPCSENCIPFCQSKSSATGECSPVCDQHTGRCMNGCKDGFRGQQCTDGCSSRCQDMRCNQTTGHCMKCVNGYYKETCHLRCYNCKDDVCEMKTGFCFECKDGYYGVDCKQTCTNCQSGLCERNDGHCIGNQFMTTLVCDNKPLPNQTIT